MSAAPESTAYAAHEMPAAGAAPAFVGTSSTGVVRRPKQGVNVPLVLGAGIVTILLFLALFGPRLAPYDPMQRFPIMRDANGEWHMHPFAPLEMPGFPLGTDFDNRDVLSRLMWAVRPTMTIALLATLIRLLVGCVLGLVAGWSAGRIGGLAGSLITLATSMPLLVVALLVLYVMGSERSAWQFVIALSLTGWAASAQLVSIRARGLRGEGYIEAARGFGAGTGFIVRRHVVPHVRALAPIIASFDVAAVLLVMAELGFIGFFLGNPEYRSIARGDSPGVWLKLIPGQPELSQMLSVGWDNVFQTPWMMLWAGLAFIMAIAGFTLLGEGLRRKTGPVAARSAVRGDGAGDGSTAVRPEPTPASTPPARSGVRWPGMIALLVFASALSIGITLGLLGVINGGLHINLKPSATEVPAVGAPAISTRVVPAVPPVGVPTSQVGAVATATAVPTPMVPAAVPAQPTEELLWQGVIPQATEDLLWQGVP
jgi:ABC-type dipeptide/oligopeptide/nickel transport system permease subunit